MMIDSIKAGIVAIWAVIMAALAPTANALMLLVLFAVVNAFVGYQSNYITKRERFSLTKFWRAGIQLMMYMGLVVLLHLAFYLFGDVDKSLFAIKVVSWIAVWGYTVKILQNCLQIAPNTRGLKLLYYVLAVKFIGKLLRELGIEVDDNEIKQIRDEEEPTKGTEE
ncbi:hypothetical protein [Porphyromonas somerae]|uniref:hypothetical protein n=1 Tax=Porphyromonas somerae TaxID=322095 RepID=UPI001FCB88AC|nr:hypothetical protein [Porphyromonas somerae]BDE81281.1 hypothetical protein CE91St14_03090 [Porphyromonas somerae]